MNFFFGKLEEFDIGKQPPRVLLPSKKDDHVLTFKLAVKKSPWDFYKSDIYTLFALESQTVYWDLRFF